MGTVTLHVNRPLQLPLAKSSLSLSLSLSFEILFSQLDDGYKFGMLNHEIYTNVFSSLFMHGMLFQHWPNLWCKWFSENWHCYIRLVPSTFLIHSLSEGFVEDTSELATLYLPCSKEEILCVQFNIKTLLATNSCRKRAGILAISRPNLLQKFYPRVLVFDGMSRLWQQLNFLYLTVVF